MRICLAANSNFGLRSELAADFGAACWLLVVDSETHDILAVDRTNPTTRDQPIDMDLILCQGMADYLYASLRQQGVPIYGSPARTVAEALVHFEDGGLRDLAVYACCRGSDPDCEDRAEHLAAGAA